jgi:hypothetical protein
MEKVIALSALAVLTGCVSAGGTVAQIYANEVSVSYEYTHWYSTEKPAAMRMADIHCQRYGKFAQVASETARTMDRTSITFNCVES